MSKIKHYWRFVIVWLANSLLIYLADSIYPSSFELGTIFVSRALAPFVAGLLLTVICKLGKLAANKLGIELKGKYAKFAYYWLINSAGIWLIARFSAYTGLGIFAYYWALYLGFFTSLSQWLIRQAFKRSKMV